VLDAEGLSSGDMQQFANWMNLSETTFVLPPASEQADYRVRIFTPSQELPFAGHPTLGTCHAWLESGGTSASPGALVQECGAGLIKVRQVPAGLAFAAPPLLRSGPVAEPLAEQLAQWLLGTGRASAPYVASQGTALGRAGRVHISTDADGQIWVGGGTVTRVSGHAEV